MKKIIVLLLCLVMCASPLTACSGGDDTTVATPPETDPETTVYDYEKIPDVIEPHEEQVISADELGYSAVITSTEKYWVADATVGEDGEITVTSYNPGTTVITVKNKYAEKVELNVTVGLDYSLESVEFEKFTMPEKYVIATDYGVKTTNADNAPYFQAAIDALPGGGTVYVPKGVYLSKLIQLKDGITIRLEGVIENYNTPYYQELNKMINEGSIAVIKSAGGDMFINHTPKSWGREGADNIAVLGGCLDMMGKSRCFVWCCADGVLLENVVMKDCLGDHAIQITGCTNVTIRDCMFAGYKSPTDKNPGAHETVQIEQGHPGAIGGTVDGGYSNPNSNSHFDRDEYYYCENVVIENVYFGKSFTYGPHSVPIGHHGHSARCSATGVRIVGCTFDNPLTSALRPYAWTDVEISGNTFISDMANALESGRYMIDIIYAPGSVTMNSNPSVYLSLGEDRGGSGNYEIYNNKFTLGSETKMMGVLKCTTLGTTSYGAKGYYRMPEKDFYKSPMHFFTGYKMQTNIAYNINVFDNEIHDSRTVAPHLYSLMAICGLRIENNEVISDGQYVTGTLSDGGEIYGAQMKGCTSIEFEEKHFKISATSANSTVPITLIGSEGDIGAYCTNSNTKTYCLFTLSATDGGRIGRWADDTGELFVEPIADEGYIFDGYYVGGERLDGDRFEFDATTEVELRFALAE